MKIKIVCLIKVLNAVKISLPANHNFHSFNTSETFHKENVNSFLFSYVIFLFCIQWQKMNSIANQMQK